MHSEFKNYPGSVHRRRSPVSPGLVLAVSLVFALAVAFFLLRPILAGDRVRTSARADSLPLASQPLPSATVFPPPEESETVQPAPAAISLPLLVNNDHPLPSPYDTSSFVLLNALETTLFTVKEPNTYAAPEAVTALNSMLAAAHQDGLTVWQISECYRSVEAQQKIWDEKYEKYRTVNGLSEKKALEAVARRVAVPGCSEHHTGLALDITVPGEAFRNTPQAEWLAAHCHEYGFVIRYTEDKEYITGITAEPWHIRYVGPEAAAIMEEENWCLEEYIQKMLKKL